MTEWLIESPRKTQFTSRAFTRPAQWSALVASMGLIGDCFDNAVLESSGRGAWRPDCRTGDVTYRCVRFGWTDFTKPGASCSWLWN